MIFIRSKRRAIAQRENESEMRFKNLFTLSITEEG
jgi:hypothetical protein